MYQESSFDVSIQHLYEIIADALIHHFVVMVRCGCRVSFTKMLSTHDAMVRSSLKFPESFEIDDIGHDSATLDVEIYGMVGAFLSGFWSKLHNCGLLFPVFCVFSSIYAVFLFVNGIPTHCFGNMQNDFDWVWLFYCIELICIVLCSCIEVIGLDRPAIKIDLAI